MYAINNHISNDACGLTSTDEYVSSWISIAARDDMHITLEQRSVSSFEFKRMRYSNQKRDETSKENETRPTSPRSIRIWIGVLYVRPVNILEDILLA